ncbi:MAG: hypothetical protein PVG75_00605 [Thioalkalispiraceae bacterium]|jgi:hypothetical protein
MSLPEQIRQSFARLFWRKTIQPVAGQAFRHIAVHPCVINNQPHIVYPRGLQAQSPEIYRQLHAYFVQQGYQLKEDQRSGQAPGHYKNERRKLVPVLLFTASLFFEGSVYADERNQHQHATLDPEHNIELRLLPNAGIDEQTTRHSAPAALAGNTRLTSPTARRLFMILQDKYQVTDDDPDYISDDFKQIANYYSEFPEIVSLLTSLENKNWQLKYQEHDWATRARGNVFEIQQAMIHFDTRSAAQLRLNNGCKQNPVCVASPADALLHELLHTHSMLVNTQEFIAQGGMNNLVYPYKHEYAIIKQERKLYARMSAQDTLKRPYRVDHTGRAVKTRCPTCIK